MFPILNIRLGKEIGRFCCQSVFSNWLRQSTHPLGYGVCVLIKYEIQTRNAKGKTFTGRDNIITGSFSSLNDEQQKR
jgi:hypothetical protein